MKDDDKNNLVEFPRPVHKVTPEELNRKLNQLTELLYEHAQEREELLYDLAEISHRLDTQFLIIKEILKEIGILEKD